MKNVVLLPHPDSVTPWDSFVYGEAVPVNIFIDGQKVDAPKAGIKVGRPVFLDIDHGTVGILLGDYIDKKRG